MKLSQLDGKRIAVVLEGRPPSTVVRGWASYEVDKDLGNCLRVRLSEAEGDPHLFFPESAEEYEFELDWRYGCDYAVTLRINHAASA
jgi:hypothetical protein